MTDSHITAIIAQAVCTHFSVSPADVDRRTRHKPVARARQVIIKLLREYGFDVHYVAHVTHCDDSNVSYATRIISKMESYDPDFAEQLQRLRIQIAETLQDAKNSQTSVQNPISTP